MCACLSMCTNAMCRSPNAFSRCFSPWYVYHGIDLMCNQAGLKIVHDLYLYDMVSE